MQEPVTIWLPDKSNWICFPQDAHCSYFAFSQLVDKAKTCECKSKVENNFHFAHGIWIPKDKSYHGEEVIEDINGKSYCRVGSSKGWVRLD